jgi:hypothetical protein
MKKVCLRCVLTIPGKRRHSLIQPSFLGAGVIKSLLSFWSWPIFFPRQIWQRNATVRLPTGEASDAWTPNQLPAWMYYERINVTSRVVNPRWTVVKLLLLPWMSSRQQFLPLSLRLSDSEPEWWGLRGLARWVLPSSEREVEHVVSCLLASNFLS